MGLNLGLFWQIGAYNRFYFRAGESDGFTGPDLPMEGYSGRTFYDGENAGGGPAIFLRIVKRGGRGAIFFENCRVVLFPESSACYLIILGNLQQLSRTFSKKAGEVIELS